MGINAHTDPKMQRRFRNDIAEHKLTVQHDENGYRHLVARKPGTGMYGFDIVTFPGTLVIRGDMGTYLFTRESDMIGFFDDGQTPELPIAINPGYWAEKTPQYGVNDTSIATRSYDRLIAQLMESAHEYTTGWDVDSLASFYRDMSEELLSALETESDIESALGTITRWEHASSEPFESAYEWDFSEYTAQFEWCCYAIVWACRMYRDIERQLTEADEAAPTDDETFISKRYAAGQQTVTVTVPEGESVSSDDSMPEAFGCPTAIEQTELRRAARETAARSGITSPMNGQR